ncbi:MAG: hypothetical protein WCF28_06270 [Methanobacterium sp.]|uniref:hypothetical protein n=1 Tax=Methanobacterium sp. TaxID=2164 RepID=UPI003C73C625
MIFISENNFSFTMDLKDENDKIWAAISVAPSKEPGNRDILLIDDNNKNISFRSITELMNYLQKRKVPYEDRKATLDFIANSLIILEKNQL